MNIDELFKSAYALLDEGAALLCAHVHVANNDTIKRHIKAVDAWRAQYRAAKEAREWQEAAVDNEQTADERVLAARGEATARVRSMREAAANVARSWGPFGLSEAIRALPLDAGTTTDLGTALVCLDCGKQQGAGLPAASGEAAGERCSWFGCHCGGLGKKTEFVPMALEDVSQLLAEVATFHRWGATRMQGLDRLMRRLDWYRRRARAWKAKAKKVQADAVTAGNNRAADAFARWDNGDINTSAEEFEAWLRSGDAAPGAVTPAKGGE